MGRSVRFHFIQKCREKYRRVKMYKKKYSNNSAQRTADIMFRMCSVVYT